ASSTAASAAASSRSSSARGTWPVSDSSKSRLASHKVSRASTPSRIAVARSPRPPSRSSAAAARADSLPASVSASTPSARERSRRPLRKARRVNSPGRAARAPSASRRARAQASSGSAPGRWNSATSSRVKERGARIQRSVTGWSPRPSSKRPRTHSRALPGSKPGRSSRKVARTRAAEPGPERRTMPRRAGPGGVEMAAIVSCAGSVMASRIPRLLAALALLLLALVLHGLHALHLLALLLGHVLHDPGEGATALLRLGLGLGVVDRPELLDHLLLEDRAARGGDHVERQAGGVVVEHEAEHHRHEHHHLLHARGLLVGRLRHAHLLQHPQHHHQERQDVQVLE